MNKTDKELGTLVLYFLLNLILYFYLGIRYLPSDHHPVVVLILAFIFVFPMQVQLISICFIGFIKLTEHIRSNVTWISLLIMIPLVGYTQYDSYYNTFTMYEEFDRSEIIMQKKELNTFKYKLPFKIVKKGFVPEKDLSAADEITDIGYNRKYIDESIISKINEYRTSKKIKVLNTSKPLGMACKLHSDYVASAYFYVGHFQKIQINGSNYYSLTSRLNKVRTKGINGVEAIEIVHAVENNWYQKHNAYVDEIIREWKNSPEHNKVLLEDNDIVGCYTSYAVTKIKIKESTYQYRKMVTTIILIKNTEYNSLFNGL